MKIANTPTAPPYYGAIKHKTLIHALQYNAVATPDKVFLRWVNSKCEVVDSLTYQQLLSRATTVATLLLTRGVKRGDRVMISYPFGLEVVAGIYGCMLLSVIPCSVYPPNPSKSAAAFSFRQFNNQVKDAGAKFALTTTKFRLVLRTIALTTSHRTNVTWLATDMLKSSAKEAILSEYIPSPRESALIQYSSGSTGEPKGIVLSHSAIIHNLERIWSDQRCKTQANSSGCTWMPQYHDFALIGFMIGPCYSDKDPCVMCSPVDFIQNPLLWADMIETFESTRTAGPNFAYALLAKRMEAAGRVLTNSTLLCTSIAAEPIAPQTLAKMAAIGFPEESMVPAYGMAEACVYLTSCYVGNTLQVLDGTVCCGDSSVHEPSGTFIVIADEESGRILIDGSVGEIFVRSPSLASGYWNKPELTQEMFGVTLDDGHTYFKSGDLGRIVSDRYLFVVGRSKELIIVNGKNIYPTDIEREVEGLYPTLVRPGSTVAFQYSDTEAGLVMELRRNVYPVDAAKLLTASIVRRLVSDAHGVQLGIVTLLRQSTVPKTTSGKLRRVDTRRMAIASEWKTSNIVWSWTKKVLQEEVESPSHEIDDTAVDDKYQDVLTSVLGEGFDLDKSWEVNGLSSLMHVELSTLVSQEFCVVLSSSFQLEYETPRALLNYIKVSGQIPFETETAPTEALPATLSPTIVGLLQAVGVFLQLLALATAFVATYFIASYVLTDNIQSVLVLKSGREIRWGWFPITIPVAMLVLTMITVATKWIVVGRYRANVEVSVRSAFFLRWWFVDRMLHLWEFWVGQFIIDTPLIWIVYSLMGAKIHASARIDCFVREFDLLTIGRGSHVSTHALACRRFSLWGEDGPSIRFRPIVIGEHCIVEGMVGLGTKLGDGCFVTETSILAEGAQVEARSVVRGKPAFREGKHAVDEWRPCDEIVLKILKTLWLTIELYIFFANMLVAQVIWNGRLPYEWRYTPLYQWVLLLSTTSFLNILVSVALKWLLIRRRTTEERLRPTLCVKLTNWVCDYHFRVSSALFRTLTAGSKIWNVILRLHGLDVDFQSGISSNDIFPPSKVDQLRVRRSFVSAGVIFQLGGAIDILDSTVGYRVNVGSGVQIHRSSVAAMMEVEQSMYDQNYQSTVSTRMFFVASEVCSLLVTVLILVCLVPAFEFFNFAVKESPVLIAVPALVLTLVIQCVSWTLLLRLVQAAALFLKRGGVVAYEPLYHTFIRITFEAKQWAQWSMLYGTPFFKTFLQCMGSNVKGDLFYNGSGLHDFHALVFEDKTIVDGCQVMGHYQVGNTLTIGTSTAAGLLHPGCVTVANARLKSNIEHGPNTAFFQHEMKEDETEIVF